MNWLRESLEGRRAVEAVPQPASPSWRWGSRWWTVLRAWWTSASVPDELGDLAQRLSSHIALFLGIGIVLFLARQGVLSSTPYVRFSFPAEAAPVTTPAAREVPLASEHVGIGEFGHEETVYAFPPYQDAAEKALWRRPVADTVSAEKELPKRLRTWIVTYEVQPGDSVWAIAKKFDLNPKTVEWANGLELNPDLLRVGQKLIIPPVDGVVHVVEPGDTLVQIARRYKVKPEDIVNFEPNGLASVDAPLPPNKVLVVPGGVKPFVAPVVSAYSGPIPKSARRGTGSFVWPTSGRITSLFNQIVCSPLLGCEPHKGLDIANVTGTPVIAADSGYVVFAGWDTTGYGNLVVINHGNGFVTYYAHMSAIFVKKGQSVAKGQRIGSIGSTGNVSGPHLHFELRQQGIQRNPIGFLPRP